MIQPSTSDQILRGLSCSYVLVAPGLALHVSDVSESFLQEVGLVRSDVIGRHLLDVAPLSWLPTKATTLLGDVLQLTCTTRLAQNVVLSDSTAQNETGSATALQPVLRCSPILSGDGTVESILLSRQLVLQQGDTALQPVIPSTPVAAAASPSTINAEATIVAAAMAAELGTFDYRLPDGPIFLNAAAAAFFFFKRDEQGTSVTDFFRHLHPEDRDRVRRAFDSSIRRQTRLDTEFRVVTADDRTQWVRAIGRATISADGVPQCCDGVLIDISREKRTEDALRESEEEARLARQVAEHASLVKDEFLSTLSHELRTPLNTILGWTQVLQRSNSRLSEKASTALATIERSARQQARLIEDLLDASAIIAGKIILDLQPVRCNDIIATSVAACAPIAAARNIKIHVAIDEPGIAVEADALRLQQILSRLLSNAIKFSPDDAIIKVRQFASNDKVMITVTDFGQGIAPAFLPSLFARFSQADGSITRTHMGLGLGLSIVKSLIELHGGRVSAASQGVSHGSVFTIELPALLSGSDAVPTAHLSDQLAEAINGDNDDWTADIVVVDDEPDAGVVMREILLQTGATVRLAASAIEAMEMIRQRRPDLIISDIGMPQVDGYQLLRMVRSEESAEQVPLPAIALTAFARPEDKRLAIEAGYLIHLAKPVESDDLITAARLAVRRPRRSIDIKPK